MGSSDWTVPTLLAGGTVMGLVVGLWSRVKAVAFRLFSLLVVTVEYQGNAAMPVAAWVARRGRRVPGGTRWYTAISEYLRPARRTRPILFETFSNESALYLIGWRPLWAGFRSMSQNYNGNDHDQGRVCLYFFRGTFDPDTLGYEAVEAAAQRMAKGESGSHRHQINTLSGAGKWAAGRMGGQGDVPDPYASPAKSLDGSSQLQSFRPVGYAYDDIGQPVSDKPFLGLVYPPEIAAAVAEVDRWLKSEDWYRARGLPWRRGWLLAGPPGCGKSRLIRAIGQQFDLPVYVFDLATMTNQELDAAWKKALYGAPCLAVFEDLDGVFQGRENVLGPEAGLTFDKLLQCLSGVASSDGVFVVVTTNRPELLDPAIGKPEADGESGRPGRIDRVITLGPPTPDARRQIIASVLGDTADEKDVARMATETDGRSAAQVVELAARTALARYWEAHG